MTSKKKSKLMFDPPQGWMYGFPKELPREVTNMRQWLIDEGYPEQDVDHAMKYSRMWQQEVDDKNNG